MALAPPDAERALRDECRSWLHEHLPWEYGRGLPPRFDDLADEVAFGREWQAQLATGRGGGVAWPGGYGGRGAGPPRPHIPPPGAAPRRPPPAAGPPGARH